MTVQDRRGMLRICRAGPRVSRLDCDDPVRLGRMLRDRRARGDRAGRARLRWRQLRPVDRRDVHVDIR